MEIWKFFLFCHLLRDEKNASKEINRAKLTDNGFFYFIYFSWKLFFSREVNMIGRQGETQRFFFLFLFPFGVLWIWRFYGRKGCWLVPAASGYSNIIKIHGHASKNLARLSHVGLRKRDYNLLSSLKRERARFTPFMITSALKKTSQIFFYFHFPFSFFPNFANGVKKMQNLFCFFF